MPSMIYKIYMIVRLKYYLKKMFLYIKYKTGNDYLWFRLMTSTVVDK